MSGAGARISHDQWTWLQSLNSNIDLATTDTNTHIGVYKIFWRLEIKSLLISLTTLWCLLEINIHWIKDTVCFHMIVGYDENTPLMIHTRFINNHGVFHVIIICVWFLNCHSTSTLNHRYAQPLILENIFLKHNMLAATFVWLIVLIVAKNWIVPVTFCPPNLPLLSMIRC